MEETINGKEIIENSLGGGGKTDIIKMIEKINDEKFLFRIYITLRDYLKEKSE